jgi:hypothetical protein
VKDILVLTFAYSITLFLNPPAAYAQLAQDQIKQSILNEYIQDPKVNKLIQADPKIVTEVTGFKQVGTNCYQTVVEMGLRTGPDKLVKFSYFGSLLKIYDVSVNAGDVELSDVTTKDLPSQKLWARYRITSHMPAAKDPNILTSWKVQKIPIYFVTLENEKADVYIPVDGPELMLGFRQLLINPNAPSMFVIRPGKPRISLTEVMTEESDGDLNFGLKGGGQTGWSPWNHEFLGLYSGIEKKRVNLLKNENLSVLPLSPNCSGVAKQ